MIPPSTDRWRRRSRRPPTSYAVPRVERIAVLIADDHPLFREGLARALGAFPEIRVVAAVGDGRAAVATIRELAPDVALVDLRLPGLDGIAVASAISRDALPTRLLILSAYDDESLVYGALEAGAAGYLTKDAPRDEVVEAIHRVAAGETVLGPALAGGLAHAIRNRGPARGPQLTEREREVLTLLVAGRSAPQIASDLVVGVATVKTHLHHVYEKLGVNGAAAAVAEALRRGLVE
jgi:two-component system, NarL family, nitrate/nitrite response regulator NarL